MYTLGEAARAVGKSKPTIARATKAGRFSAGRTDDGSYAIDSAELARVYPVTVTGNGHLKQSVPGFDTGDAARHLERLLLEREETIRDRRARLDSRESERRKLTAMLTAQRPAAPATVWGRFLAWRRWR